MEGSYAEMMDDLMEGLEGLDLGVEGFEEYMGAAEDTVEAGLGLGEDA